MNKTKKFFTIAMLLALLPFLACTKTAKKTDFAIDPNEAMGQAVNKFAVLVDFRGEEVVKRVGGLPVGLIFSTEEIMEQGTEWKTFLQTHAKDKTIILLGPSGKTAQEISEKNKSTGIQFRYVGTFSDWKKAGLPTTDAEK